MSVKKTLSLTREKAGKSAMSAMPAKKTLSLNAGNRVSSSEPIGPSNDAVVAKRRRTARCFSFMEINIEKPAGSTSLEDVDSNKLKAEIKRWAKAVVRYARQVSDRFARSSSNVSG